MRATILFLLAVSVLTPDLAQAQKPPTSGPRGREIVAPRLPPAVIEAAAKVTEEQARAAVAQALVDQVPEVAALTLAEAEETSATAARGVCLTASSPNACRAVIDAAQAANAKANAARAALVPKDEDRAFKQQVWELKLSERK